MFKKTAAILALSLVASGPAMAGDWSDFYAKVYGGVSLPNSLDHGGFAYPLDHGLMGGMSLGIATPIEGVSFELDLTHSSALYTGFNNSLNGTTFMANVVFTAPVADTFSIYGGLGVGALYAFYDNVSATSDASGMAAAAQVFAGASVDVVPNLSLFGEVRYQTALGDVTVTDSFGPYPLAFARAAVVGGLKFSF